MNVWSAQGWVGRAQQRKGGQFSVFGTRMWLGNLTPLSPLRVEAKVSHWGHGSSDSAAKDSS